MHVQMKTPASPDQQVITPRGPRPSGACRSTRRHRSASERSGARSWCCMPSKCSTRAASSSACRGPSVADTFDPEEVAVIGLHTVFEHHEAMTSMALDACIHEYRLGLPIGVDEPGDGPVPVTMCAYGLRGTPSLVLIDRLGRRRRHSFGAEPDLLAGRKSRSCSRRDLPTIARWWRNGISGTHIASRAFGLHLNRNGRRRSGEQGCAKADTIR